MVYLFEVIAQYKPTKCTFVKLVFYLLRSLVLVSNPAVHLQEDGCTYRYGMILFTCNVRSSLQPTRQHVPLHLKYLYLSVLNVLLTVHHNVSV
jgi:hypothetical protein